MVHGNNVMNEIKEEQETVEHSLKENCLTSTLLHILAL